MTFERISLSALTFVLTGSAALAQPVIEPAEDADDSDAIVVTAQKREQRVQDVPSPISVIDGGQIEAAGITNITDLGRITSGVVYNKNGAFAQPTIRGIGTRSSGAGDSSNVAVYVDGVYLSAQQGGFSDFNNIDRVEVLKGPQGTLFGRNATGGAISVVTRKPSHVASAEGSIAYGNYDRRTAKIYGTAGLAENVAIDVAAFYDEDDGFTRDILSGAKLKYVDNHGVRSKLLWEPTETLTVTLAADYGRYRSSQGFAYTPIGRNASTVRTEPATARVGERRGEVALSFVPFVLAKQYGGSLTASEEGDALTLTSITSYRDVRARDFLDSDATQLPRTSLLIVAPTRTLTQEFYAASNGERAISWVGGIFFLTETAKREPTRVTSISAAGLTTRNETVVNAKTLAFAPYGEVTVSLANSFKLIGGVRYSYEQRKLKNFLNGAPRVNNSANFDNLDYRATAQYFVNGATNFYAIYSTGFKSGVFNTSTFDGIAIRPEKVDAYELGVKSSIGRFTVNADVFQYDYADIQISRSVNPATGQTLLQNAASARIKGAEFEASGRLFDGLRANVGITYLHGRYRSFPAADVLVPVVGGGNRSVALDVSGLPTIRTPKWTAVAGLNYTAELAGGNFAIGGSAYYSSSFAYEPSGRVRQPSHTLLQGQIGWTTADERFGVTIYGENLTDEAYFENVAISAGGDFANFATPRRYGVRLNFKFD